MRFAYRAAENLQPPGPEKFFALLVIATVIVGFLALSGCTHQPPGDGLYLLVR